ncbi:exo-alpha-sialidase [Streptomyces sp. NBC_01618]|uniref:exo-alpha-sialidase n=1 Tax=Streptomyces sp. NBC_01618 TaxID=2975900 RepID=UPI00386CBC39|nr:exo-alpha-sialidase [Streptomyces sp. NBC_01618]
MSRFHRRFLWRTGLAGLSAAVALTGVAPVAVAAAAEPKSDFDATPSQAGEPFYAEQQLATNGEGGFPNYRIPALAVTNGGDILASYDGRPSSMDAPGPNSVLQRRSTDGGKTWGEQTFVHEGKVEVPITGYSDPSYMMDRHTGDVFNFHVKSFDKGFGGSQPGVDPDDRNALHAEVSVSRDEGRTWEHKVITADITDDLGWRSRFAASGQGIQLKYGEHAGRLIQQFTIINGAGAFQAVSVYSDDHGKSWKAGKPVGVGMDENKTVELSDGRVMLNSRDSHRSGYRKVTISEDGGVTYGEVTIDRELPDPTNNAAIVRAYPNAPEGSDRAKVLLFSNAGSTSQRANGTIRMSFDDGETWPVSRVFQPGGMAYSTLATLPNGNIGLLYEPDAGNGGIRFAQFSLAWLQGVAAPLTVTDVSVERGSTQSFEITVANQSGAALHVKDLALAVPDGWSYEVAAPHRILPGASEAVTATVTVPASATGSSYRLTATLTDVKGRTSHGTFMVKVPKTEEELTPGRILVTGGTLTNPQTDGYQADDKLVFSYTVTNLSDAATTVVPSGNLKDFDPKTDSRNCRYRTLQANASYTCDFPYHVVTQDDLTAGHFTPRSTWTSTSGDTVTVVEHDGERVELG